MFVKAVLQCSEKRKVDIILNVNRIISMNSLQDGYIYVRADTGGARSELCLIKPEDLVYVIREDPMHAQVIEWLCEHGWEENIKPIYDIVEPNTLGERGT